VEDRHFRFWRTANSQSLYKCAFSLIGRRDPEPDSATLLRFKDMENIEAANERIANLKQRRDQLTARLQRLQQAEKARQRKLRTRRLILMGTLMEARAKDDPAYRQRVLAALGGFLDKPRDRALFDLPQQDQE